WSLDITTGIAMLQQVDGNTMDQNPDGIQGQPDDTYTTQDPNDQKQIPLIVPGPHIISSNVPGQTPTVDNLVLNSTVSSLDVTFDRNMDDSTISGADVLKVVGPA